MEGGITQLRDFLDQAKFKDIILAGITTAEKYLDEGEKDILAGRFEHAEEMWVLAWENMRWVALNIIQRRLRLGKNEGIEVRRRFMNFWKRMATFGLKRKLAEASVS